MTAWQIYCILKLDGARFLLGSLGIVFSLFWVVFIFPFLFEEELLYSNCETNNEIEKVKINRYALGFLVFLFSFSALCVVASVLMPSTRTAIAMYYGPQVLKSNEFNKSIKSAAEIPQAIVNYLNKAGDKK